MNTKKIKNAAGILAVSAALAVSYAAAQYQGGQSGQAAPSQDNSAPSAQSDQPSSMSGAADQGMQKGDVSPSGSSMGTSGSQMGAGANVSGLSDREIASKVRRALYDDKSLSSAAHKVKIKAANGRVSLQGKVKTQQDKDGIFNKAADIVGSDKIDNDLQVK